MALFVTQFYDALPRLSIFAQDDGHGEHHHGKLIAALSGRDAHALAAWADDAERRPFAESDTCLCHAFIEDWWNACPEHAPFPPDTPRCYGDTYWPMRWFMETFLDFPNAGEDWGAVRWPEAAQLVVPAWAIRSRPKLVFSVILQLLNSTYLPLGPEADAGQKEYPLLHRSAQLHWRPWGTHEWAHIFERLWFVVFDARYTPQGPGAPPAPGAAVVAAGQQAVALAAPPPEAPPPPGVPAVGAAPLLSPPPPPPSPAAPPPDPRHNGARAAAKAAVDEAEGLLFDLRLPGADDAAAAVQDKPAAAAEVAAAAATPGESTPAAAAASRDASAAGAEEAEFEDEQAAQAAPAGGEGVDAGAGGVPSRERFLAAVALTPDAAAGAGGDAAAAAAAAEAEEAERADSEMEETEETEEEEEEAWLLEDEEAEAEEGWAFDEEEAEAVEDEEEQDALAGAGVPDRAGGGLLDAAAAR
jgi:hypothetical protein